jgi:hypothetical protein
MRLSGAGDDRHNVPGHAGTDPLVTADRNAPRAVTRPKPVADIASLNQEIRCVCGCWRVPWLPWRMPSILTTRSPVRGRRHPRRGGSPARGARRRRRSGHLHRAATRCDRQIGAPVDREGVAHCARTFSPSDVGARTLQISTTSSRTRFLRRNAAIARSSRQAGLWHRSTSTWRTQFAGSYRRSRSSPGDLSNRLVAHPNQLDRSVTEAPCVDAVARSCGSDRRRAQPCAQAEVTSTGGHSLLPWRVVPPSSQDRS